jgi:phage recombination protein Bet
MELDLVVPSDKDNRISKAVSYFSPEEVAIIKNTVAKNTTDTELAFFLMIASGANLNPLLKEIWCYKDNKGNVLVFASRDGFIKKAQHSPTWNGFTSAYVCTNDFFEISVDNEKVRVKHTYKVSEDRGVIVGAYCIAKPKGAEYPIVEWCDIATYDKKQFVWSSHKGAMIQKVAEVHCLKKAYGISGLQYEDDYYIKDDVALPSTQEPDVTIGELQELYELKKDALSAEEKENAERIINNKEKNSYAKLHRKLKSL